MNLRPYQLQCVERVRSEFARNAATLVVMATGCGKTVVFAHLARDWHGRVLVLAHREELIEQAADKLRTVSGERPGIEMGAAKIDEHAFDRPRLVVSSVQTMCRPGRQKKFDPREFGLVIIDEAHHAPARTYKDVLDYFRQNPAVKTLGVTATPKRADELAMGQLFDSVAFEYGIEPAILDGYLVPVRQQAVIVEGLDFSKVRSVAGDFNEGELERILSEEKILHAVAAPTIEIAEDRSALVFCVGVDHARLMAAVLNRYKSGSAVALDGTTPKDVRASTVAAFREGRIQFLCNCALFLEGFDAPGTALVVMARPTKSLTLFTQVLGRGTRPLPGVVDGLADAAARRAAIAASAKPFMISLDFVGNSGRHRIISAADLLGGKYTEPVRRYARETAAEEGKAVDVEQSLERASDEVNLLVEMQEMRRREGIRAQAEYQTREVSPFGYGGGPRQDVQVEREPATDKQKRFLLWKGWKPESVERLSKRQASGIIGKLKGGAA